MAEALIEVSGGSGDGETCSTYADCAQIILDGGTADYDGISGPITFDEVGDPTEASLGINQLGADTKYAAYYGGCQQPRAGPRTSTGALSRSPTPRNLPTA